MKKAMTVCMIVVLHLVAACAPAEPTPTPTPEPTPTPVKVLATKPEHLAGLWFNPEGHYVTGKGLYYEFKADGTYYWAPTLEGLADDRPLAGNFWFEDGVYYEESRLCLPIGSYRVYLEIAEGRAVGLRFEQIEDSDRSCIERSLERRVRYRRVD